MKITENKQTSYGIQAMPTSAYTYSRHRQAKKRVVMSKTCAVHNIFTHFPKCGECPVCRDNKPMRQRCESNIKAERPCDALPKPEVFGDAGTLDHKIMNEDGASRDGDRVACIILDRATYWQQAYADETKSTKATIRALQKLYGHRIREICKAIFVFQHSSQLATGL